MDYLISNSREEMLENRELINTIDSYMLSQGYKKSPKTKNPHSLDSWVYDYMGAKIIEVEINYSLRSNI
jgi:hypothetical protein